MEHGSLTTRAKARSPCCSAGVKEPERGHTMCEADTPSDRGKRKGMQAAKTWRELLGSILRDAQEEQRLIDMLGVRPITLARWVQQKSDPRPYFLRQLLAALPQQREFLLPLIEQEFPGFAETVDEEAVPREIASPFYAQVLETYSTTAPSLRFWSLCPLIFQQILTHLDPDQLGMQLILAR